MKRLSANRSPIPATDAVRRITPSLLQQTFDDTSQRWWSRRLTELEALGILSRRGRLLFGRIEDVEAWLMGSGGQAVAK